MKYIDGGNKEVVRMVSLIGQDLKSTEGPRLGNVFLL